MIKFNNFLRFYCCIDSKINSIFDKNMKYLSPEIEALSKQFEITKSLARTNVSCGIFQDCDYNEKRPQLYQNKNSI